MDFIISLAHFCEDHGPTSILCTQVIPPACSACYPNVTPSVIARTPSNGSSSATPPGSSHGLTASRMRDGRSGENTPAASPRGLSPSATPPSSPRNGFSTLPTSAAGGMGAIQDSGCKNCSITIPPRINSGATNIPGVRDGKPRFRTTESYVVNGPAVDDGDTPDAVDISAGSLKSLDATSHTHTITYLSCRAPTLPSRFATVRQFCIRALNHEFSHQKISPVMFGDIITGWCIYVTFKLPDPKSRGALRTYAVLCISPNQRALVHSWNLITHTFLGFIHKIQHEVAAKAAQDAKESAAAQPTQVPISFRPEGFLRRHPGMDGSNQRSLAELTGQEDFFLGVHTTFVQLLSNLTKIHGFATSGHDSPVPLPPNVHTPPMVTGTDGRSRAASIGSHSPEDPKYRRTQSPRGLEKEILDRAVARERDRQEELLPSPSPSGSRSSGSTLTSDISQNPNNAGTGTSTLFVRPVGPTTTPPVAISPPTASQLPQGKKASPPSNSSSPQATASTPTSKEEISSRRQVAVG